MEPSSANPADPTQLVRYTLQIEHMPDNESLMRVRECLTDLGLLVDRLEPDEAEVSTAYGTNPGPDAIGQALQQAGFRLLSYTTDVG